MKTTLPTKSKFHEERIRQIADVIIEVGQDKIAFVILFGSFARGNWVFDRYSEGRITYQYASDYDFLIITKTAKQAGGPALFELIKKINNRIAGSGLYDKYGHNPHFVVEPIKRVNDDLRRSKYFFSDIKKEGVVLYDSGDFELSIPEKLSEKERKEMAREDYDYWMSSANDFLKITNFCLSEESLNKSAFSLHQATESLYACVSLVRTGYKPKTHDLEELNNRCAIHSRDFLSIFPANSQEEKDNFALLQKAYVDARYNKEYVITKEQLYYLITRVENLKKLVESVCEKFV